jgi:hypothetical protein
LTAQDVVIVLGEAMSLVANILQQPQRERVAAEPQRLGLPRHVDFLLAFGQRDKRGRGDVQFPKSGDRGVQLPFAAIDQQQIGKDLGFVAQPPIPPRDDFVDAAEVVDAGDFADLVPSIARFERQAVDELDQAGHGLPAAQMRDIDAFERARRGVQVQTLRNPANPFLGST